MRRNTSVGTHTAKVPYSTKANSATTPNVTLVPPRWSEIAPFPAVLDPDVLEPDDGDEDALDEVALAPLFALLKKAPKFCAELSSALIALQLCAP